MKCNSICDYNSCGKCSLPEISINCMKRCSSWKYHNVDDSNEVEHTLFIFYQYLDRRGKEHSRVSKVTATRNIKDSTVRTKNEALRAFVDKFTVEKSDCILVRRNLRIYHAFELFDLPEAVNIDII